MVRTLSALVLSFLIAIGTVFASPSATAADPDEGDVRKVRESARAHNADDPGDVPVIGTCHLVAPATVRVTQPVAYLPVRLTNGCASGDYPYALWYVGPHTYPSDFIAFEAARTSTWEMWDDTPLGTRTWQPDGAWSNNFGAAYRQNSPQTTVKLGSWAGLWTARSGNTVSISTQVNRYSTSWQRVIGWGGASGMIQFRPSGTTTWKNLKTVTADGAGIYRYRFSNSVRGDYRVVHYATPQVWEATSPIASR